MFALSYTEATNSSYGLNSATGRIGKATDYAAAYGSDGYYWLRSPNDNYDYNARRVYRGGRVSSSSVGHVIGVRPAFRIKIS